MSALFSSQNTHSAFRLRVSALFIWAAALAYLSLAPGVDAPAGLPLWDKFNHFAAYAILSGLLLRVLASRHRVSLWILMLAWLVCTGFGLFLEGLQWLMGVGRQWEPGDLLANALGALVMCVIFRHASMKFSVINER